VLWRGLERLGEERNSKEDLLDDTVRDSEDLLDGMVIGEDVDFDDRAADEPEPVPTFSLKDLPVPGSTTDWDGYSEPTPQTEVPADDAPVAASLDSVDALVEQDKGLASEPQAGNGADKGLPAEVVLTGLQPEPVGPDGSEFRLEDPLIGDALHLPDVELSTAEPAEPVAVAAPTETTPPAATEEPIGAARTDQAAPTDPRYASGWTNVVGGTPGMDDALSVLRSLNEKRERALETARRVDTALGESQVKEPHIPGSMQTPPTEEELDSGEDLYRAVTSQRKS